MTEKSLDETLAEAYDKAQEVTDDKPAPEVSEPDPDVKEAAPEDNKEAPGRERDEKGRFAKKEEKQETPSEVIQPSEIQPPKEEVASQPPASWSPTAKATWSSLPPDIRAEVLRRENDNLRALQKNNEHKKQYDALEAVLGPRRQMLAASYGDEVNGLKTLFALSDFATKDPAGFLQYFANQRGIDLRSLNMQPQTVDPTIVALRQQLQTIQDNLSQLRTQQETSVNTEVDRLFEAFRNNPANIYFEEVKDDMALLLEKGLARDYQEAYDKAIRLNDAVQEQMLSARKAEQEKQRKEEAERKAAEAKKIIATNVATKSVVGSSPAKPDSVDEIMSKVWDEHHGAA